MKYQVAVISDFANMATPVIIVFGVLKKCFGSIGHHLQV